MAAIRFYQVEVSVVYRRGPRARGGGPAPREDWIVPDQSMSPRAEAFVTLTPRQRRFSRRPGCLLMLGGPMMGFGLWLISVAVLRVIVIVPAPMLIGVGAGFALLGFVLLVSRMRRVSWSGLPEVEVAIAGGKRLRPGASAALRLRQPGPARIERLTVSLVCERHYSRQVLKPDASAVTSTDESEVVWSEDLLDERDIRVSARARLEKVVTLTVPTLAKPTGPVLPGGSIWWHLDVRSDTGGGTPLLDQFNIVVVLPGDATAPASRTEATTDKDPVDASNAASGLSVAVGCGLITLAFMLVGPAFLYFYFSGAPTQRGNPVMALVGGVVFTGVGLLALVWLVKQFFEKP